MDEPFGALDPQTRWGMQSLLLDVSRTEDNTILFVTHDVSEAVYLADTIYVLSPRPARILHRVDVPFFAVRDMALKSAAEFRAVEKKLLDLLYAPAAALHVECDRMSAPEKPSSARPTPPATPAAPRRPGSGSAMASAIRDTREGLREERHLREAAVPEDRVQQPLQPLAALGGARRRRHHAESGARDCRPRRRGLWLLHAPDSQRLQHLLWDPRFERIRTRCWSRSARSA